MYRLSTAIMVLVLGSAGVLSTGCGGADNEAAIDAAERTAEAMAEKATGEKVDIEASGEVDMSALPEFLRIPGAKAIGKVAMSTSEGKGTVWTLETSEPAKPVWEWYRAQLTGQGWTKVSELETTESMMLNFKTADETQTVAILVTEAGGLTTISLTHAMK
ncbi:MAG: hypothetical protein JSU73_01340 [candidate division WOR-3 bacterium]|nr:MAG: hypothetical protein JSU73_01340 [candidate division WOR-3 bacterium]